MDDSLKWLNFQFVEGAHCRCLFGKSYSAVFSAHLLGCRPWWRQRLAGQIHSTFEFGDYLAKRIKSGVRGGTFIHGWHPGYFKRGHPMGQTAYRRTGSSCGCRWKSKLWVFGEDGCGLRWLGQLCTERCRGWSLHNGYRLLNVFIIISSWDLSFPREYKILTFLYKISGEMSHHEVLDAVHNNVSVFLVNHSNSERGFLLVFQDALKRLLKNDNVEISVSKQDADPLVTY